MPAQQEAGQKCTHIDWVLRVPFRLADHVCAVDNDIVVARACSLQQICKIYIQIFAYKFCIQIFHIYCPGKVRVMAIKTFFKAVPV
eukprot:COSAG03_NODE_987_length_5098_cov_24.705341_7_plen_86_part_00